MKIMMFDVMLNELRDEVGTKDKWLDTGEESWKGREGNRVCVQCMWMVV